MTKITVYIAVSLDGYIATSDGKVDWLSEYEGGEEDYGYYSYYNSVDCLIMGRKTYDQVLDFGKWPYPGKPTYVFTRKNLKKKYSDVLFVPGSIKKFVEELKSKKVKHAWLVGGSNLIEGFLKHNLVKGFIITYIPKLLGRGIPLFGKKIPELKLKTGRTKKYSTGLVQVNYDIEY